MMKKVCALCVFFSLIATQTSPAAELRVLATTFPVYLFARNVTRNCPDVRVDLLIPAQTGCPHEYSLTPHDMQKLENAQIIVKNGLGIDSFLNAHLRAAGDQTRSIDCSADIQTLQVNPHLFAAPKKAAMMARVLAAGLAAHDPEHADAYTAAATAYIERLMAVDKRLAALGLSAQNRPVVLQHNALAYLAARAGLRVVAIIQEDEDTPPTPARLMALARVARNESAALLIGDVQYSDKMLRALSRETGVPYVRLDTAASGPDDAPIDYYETVMNANCRILERYFGQ